MAAVTGAAAAALDGGVRSHSMNKFQRIQLVRSLGLNTEVNVLISSESDWAAHATFLAEHPTLSVRTFRAVPWSGPEPHFPLITREELDERYHTLLSGGLSLIVAEPVDPKDAELAGCLMVQADHFIAEVADGPGTVRRVTHEGHIDRIVPISSTNPSGDPRLDAAVREARKALSAVVHVPFYELQGLIFEFSWYHLPIGWKRHPLIFWEVAGSEAQEAFLNRLVGGSS